MNGSSWEPATSATARLSMSTAAAPVSRKAAALSATGSDRSWARQQLAACHWAVRSDRSAQPLAPIARRHDSRALARNHLARQEYCAGSARRIESPGHTPADQCGCASVDERARATRPQHCRRYRSPRVVFRLRGMRAPRAAASWDPDGAPRPREPRRCRLHSMGGSELCQSAVRRQRPKRKIGAIAVISEVEHSRKPRRGEARITPEPVCLLCSQQVLNAAAHRSRIRPPRPQEARAAPRRSGGECSPIFRPAGCWYA